MYMKETIEKAITDALQPQFLEVIDESHMHSVPEGAQSHFKVTVVSDKFKGEKLVARHRLINGLLREAFSGSLHALALHTMTPEEWYEKGAGTIDSPECMGGSKQK
ncbi:MAG: BolA/IbaG family iron-sulfur metabolism protein [Candidatus Sedimenticola sp. (ex Thyasira tokunagai)]